MPALSLLVLRCRDLDRSRAFYEELGLRFVEERHGTGPDHLAATLDGGTVLELYPASGPVDDGVRLRFAVSEAGTVLGRLEQLGFAVNRARAVATDPDHRRVEVVGAGQGWG